MVWAIAGCMDGKFRRLRTSAASALTGTSAIARDITTQGQLPCSAYESIQYFSRSRPVSPTKFSAVISILLGVAAIILPYLFGTFAVMLLGGVMLASGIVALLYVNAVRREGIPVSVFAPWVQVIAGVVILIWPELALWIVAVILGGGLILSGIAGLTALSDAGLVNPPVRRKIELWLSIALGTLLIALGSAGSAILLGVVLGVALISAGLQQWRLAA
jgi:uncharacterized membrane protein HdeD (DUF308 family)